MEPMRCNGKYQEIEVYVLLCILSIQSEVKYMLAFFNTKFLSKYELLTLFLNPNILGTSYFFTFPSSIKYRQSIRFSSHYDGKFTAVYLHLFNQ